MYQHSASTKLSTHHLPVATPSLLLQTTTCFYLSLQCVEDRSVESKLGEIPSIDHTHDCK